MYYIQNAIGFRQISEQLVANVSLLFEKLVLPYIGFTEDEKGDFEDEPDVFISNDLEQSDQETKRRSCFNLLSTLSRKPEFREPVAALISQIIQ